MKNKISCAPLFLVVIFICGVIEFFNLFIADDTLRSPYDHYQVTQGTHGQSYGQLAIDIAAGPQATIKSPINGVVSQKGVDISNNTILVIINKRYIVTLAHGNYSVKVGTKVNVGDRIGTEGNNGLVFNIDGVRCTKTLNPVNCGYHTHINVYDKALGKNIDLSEIWLGY